MRLLPQRMVDSAERNTVRIRDGPAAVTGDRTPQEMFPSLTGVRIAEYPAGKIAVFGTIRKSEDALNPHIKRDPMAKGFG